MAIYTLDKLIFNKLPLVTHTQSVLSLCSPLNAQFGINHFGYGKLYDDKSVALLTTHPSLCEIFIKKKLYEKAYIGTPRNYLPGYYIVDLINDDALNVVVNAAKEACQLGHYFIIVKPSNNCCEFFYFAADSKDESINLKYLNNIEVFEKFITHFKTVMHKEIHQAENNRILYPSTACDKSIIENANWSKCMTSTEFSILTPREREILLAYKQELSSKSVGRTLNISYRTVEKHLENIRYKTGCNKILELFNNTDIALI